MDARSPDDTRYVARDLDSDHTGCDGLQFVIAGGGSNLDVYNQFIKLFNSPLLPLR